MCNCVVCGTDITERAKRRANILYCSQGCINKASNAKRKGKHGSRLRHHTCDECGGAFTSPKHAAKRCPNCRPESKPPKSTPIEVRVCGVCGKTYCCRASSVAIACKPCVSKHGEFIAARIARGEYQQECPSCGVHFSALPGGCGACRSSCSDACERAIIRAWKVRAKAIRRAKAQQGDRIVPERVFLRDQWKCVSCGRKTPKHMRGTYQDNAPELDHIIPLSKGGGHTWDNVQTLCRACNARKGNGSLYDQLLLIG